MKLLFDQNLSHRLPDRLADLFPSSTQVRQIGMDRSPDADVWDYARQKGADVWDYARQKGHAVVTRDVDLAEIATLRGPPLVIWLRGENSSTAAVEAALRARHAGIHAAGARAAQG